MEGEEVRRYRLPFFSKLDSYSARFWLLKPLLVCMYFVFRFFTIITDCIFINQPIRVSYKYKKIEVKSGPLAIACCVMISRAKIGFFVLPQGFYLCFCFGIWRPLFSGDSYIVVDSILA